MSGMTQTDTKTMKVLTHVLGLLTGFLGPLIILLVHNDGEVKDHARMALNWQISYLIYSLIAYVIMVIGFVLMIILIGFVFIAIAALLLLVAWILDLVFCIQAAIKANNNEFYEYPLTLKFVN